MNKNEQSALAPFQDQIVLALRGARAFQLVPSCADRAAWDALDTDTRVLLTAAAEAHKAPSAQTTLLDFVSDPDKYRAARNAKRDRLRALALGVCADGSDRYILPLADAIWSILAEGTWLDPGVVARGEDPLPGTHSVGVDECAAETALDLALACQMAGGRLAAFSESLISRVGQELEARVVAPFTSLADWCLSQEHVSDCLAGCMAAFLTFEVDDKRRWNCMRKAWRQLDELLSALPEDGSLACGASGYPEFAQPLAECLEMVRAATEGEIDIMSLALPERLFRYVARCHLTKGFFLNPGERSPKPRLDGVTLYRIGEMAGDDLVCNLGAYLARLYGLQTPRENLWRAVYRATRAKAIARERPQPPMLPQWYLPQAQLFAARAAEGSDAGFLLASYGGDNGNPGGHLDVGNLTLFANGEPILADMGAYADTDLHNLPTVGGFTQQFGRQYRAQDAACRLTEDYALLTLDLSTAYPEGAGVYGWQRTAIYIRDENSVQLIDAFDLTRRQVVQFHFLSAIKPVAYESHVQLGSVRMKWEPKLTVQTEEIPVKDESLTEIWGETLYRITFATADEVDGGKYTFTFNLLKTYG